MVLSLAGLAAIGWKKEEHLEPSPVCRVLFPLPNLERSECGEGGCTVFTYREMLVT